MPIPAFAGIPWLASFVGGLFTVSVTWLAQFLTRRVAFVVAAIAVIVSITTAFYAAIDALLSSFTVVLPPFVTDAAALVLPDNVPFLMSAIISAHLLRWVYEWNVKVVQMKLF